jgi:hypothetical protein
VFDVGGFDGRLGAINAGFDLGGVLGGYSFLGCIGRCMCNSSPSLPYSQKGEVRMTGH